MHGKPHTLDITPQRVERHGRVATKSTTLYLLLAGLMLANLALLPSLKAAAALPLTPPITRIEPWAENAPRLSYKPGQPKKVLLLNDSYRQIRTDIEAFTHSVATMREGIRQQLALSEVLMALQAQRPGLTPDEAQKLLAEAGYDIPTPEVEQAMHDSQSQFMKDDNVARARFAEEIAKEIIRDKIGGLLKNIELITRVGQYVLLDSEPEELAQ